MKSPKYACQQLILSQCGSTYFAQVFVLSNFYLSVAAIPCPSICLQQLLSQCGSNTLSKYLSSATSISVWQQYLVQVFVFSNFCLSVVAIPCPSICLQQLLSQCGSNTLSKYLSSATSISVWQHIPCPSICLQQLLSQCDSTYLS